MKKIVLGFILGMITCISFQAIATTTNIFKAEKASFDILVNGEKLTNSDKPTVVIDGSTYLPLRTMGNALNVPVEWNADLKRVEVGTEQSKVTKYKVKSNSLKINPDDTLPPVVFKNNKYYLRPAALFNYMQGTNGMFYLKIPNKDPILYQQNNAVTEYAIKADSLTYLDIEACGLKYTLDGDILWVEL